ncbi:MAG: signal peptidase I [Candidatus Marsarchaeota archaeon]|nr:signal peptidase I [Candidatus Marsarchaeota archaeon]
MPELKRTVIYFTLVVLVVGGGFVAVAQGLHTSLPLAAVTSGSMTPQIKQGDLIVVQGVNTSRLGVGDIIVYCSTDPYLSDCKIVHRIVEVVRQNGEVVGFITKGDNNLENDALAGFEPVTGIPPSRVIGKVVFVLPLLGWVVILVKTPEGLALVISLLILYFVVDALRASSRK